MFAVIEAAFALFGLIALVGLLTYIRVLIDGVDAHREAVAAGKRISTAAAEAEQAMLRAARHYEGMPR